MERDGGSTMAPERLMNRVHEAERKVGEEGKAKKEI